MIESLKIRFKHEWHIRCPHFSLADLDLGMSSDKHVRHSTLATVSLKYEPGSRIAPTISLVPGVLVRRARRNFRENLTAWRHSSRLEKALKGI